MLDIHPGWSGPCELMFPTYRSLGTSIDDFEKRMNFLLMDFEVIQHTTQFKNDKFSNFFFILACTCIHKFMFLLVLLSLFLGRKNCRLSHRIQYSRINWKNQQTHTFNINMNIININFIFKFYLLIFNIFISNSELTYYI